MEKKILIKKVNMGVFFILLYTITAYAFENYPTQGMASWYSTKSAQQEGTSGIWTANGERFDDNGLTCALRSRDFGIYYKVTNIANGNFIIVRHNDFGPNKKLFEQGRIIDLSKKAFSKIADLNHGTIKVKIEPVRTLKGK